MEQPLDMRDLKVLLISYQHETLLLVMLVVNPGGGALDSHLDGGGVPLGGGGWKPEPVSNRSAHQKYTLSQYTLLKTFICIPCTGTDGLSILLCIIIHS